MFQQLIQRPYVEVPFSIEPRLLQQAVDAFFRFLDEPDSIKNHIDFTIAPEHRRGDVGYKHRDAGEHIYNDSKDFFHFHPALIGKYDNFLSENPVVADFVLKAQPIWELVAETIRSILLSLESQCSGIVDKVFATEHPHILLRFLKYEWQESGKYLAKPHFDAGSCTLAIAESCSGLRMGTCPQDLELIKHQEQHALFMLSSNFRQLLDKDELSACWHDVIQLDEDCIGKPFARWAVVAFIEAHGVKALPRTETHKWAKGVA